VNEKKGKKLHRRLSLSLQTCINEKKKSAVENKNAMRTNQKEEILEVVHNTTLYHQLKMTRM
jgi:hypothetical protein